MALLHVANINPQKMNPMLTKQDPFCLLLLFTLHCQRTALWQAISALFKKLFNGKTGVSNRSCFKPEFEFKREFILLQVLSNFMGILLKHIFLRYLKHVINWSSVSKRLECARMRPTGGSFPVNEPNVATIRRNCTRAEGQFWRDSIEGLW